MLAEPRTQLFGNLLALFRGFADDLCNQLSQCGIARLDGCQFHPLTLICHKIGHKCNLQMRQSAREKMKLISEGSARIKALRGASGMNQVAFAKALGAARSLIAACESGSGKRVPTAGLLVKLGN